MQIVRPGTISLAPDDTLPFVCARSGVPTTSYLVHELFESPTLSWLFYLLGPIGFLAQYLSSAQHSVRIPIAPAVFRRYRLVSWITGIAVVVSLFVALFPPLLVLLVTALVARWVLLRRVWVTARMRNGRVVISGCHPDFVSPRLGSTV